MSVHTSISGTMNLLILYQSLYFRHYDFAIFVPGCMSFRYIFYYEFVYFYLGTMRCVIIISIFRHYEFVRFYFSTTSLYSSI